MTYQEVLEQARTCMGKCHACPVCSGLTCKNMVPGPGAKGLGTGAIRNYQKWQELCVNMDTICENAEVDTSYDFFSHKLTIPVMEGAVDALKHCGGCGVPTVKPWNMETIRQKMDMVKAADPYAIAMDIDAAGLPFLKGLTPPAGSKTVAQLKDIAAMAGKPFILKGIMTVAGAEKALEAGAAGIVVSNHGGRVLDQCPATAEVLPAIADAVGGKMKIFVDGGIRSGMDVFKALALGADAVLIARPFVTMVYGGAEEGVAAYVDKLKAELADTMAMCGARSLADIKRSMLFGF